MSILKWNILKFFYDLFEQNNILNRLYYAKLLSMKCPKCKIDNPDDNQFFGKCGTYLIYIPTTPTEASTETEKAPENEL